MMRFRKVIDRGAIVIAEVLQQQQLSVKFQPTRTHNCIHKDHHMDKER